MARMMPPEIYAGCASRGEREIFQRLKDSPDTGNWVVLHSLDVANHRKQVSGEIDFVIIIPSKGVLCVEVKACQQLRRHDGRWYYGPDTTGDLRGPFKQASEAMHSIRQRIVSRRPDLSRIVFWSAVIFTHVEFNAVSEEWHPWQVVDSRLFRSRPLNVILERIIDQARSFLQTCSTATWFYPESQEPFPAQCESLAAILRPDFEFYESPKSQAHRRDEELKRYTVEQFIALDAMEANPRVAFVGPAGTGKTLLAIEAARRGRAAGRRILLLCYNNLLGRWLEEQAAELQPQVQAKTLHSHMLAVSKHNGELGGNNTDFWSTDLPRLATDRLLECDTEEYIFDEIVIDEAQDILRDNYLDFLDLSVRGGLSSGRWRFFGDFEKQAIYDRADLSLEEVITTRAGHAPVYSLRVNCRNTPRVAGLVHLLGGLDPGYSKILRPDDGVEPELHYYSDNTDQQTILIKALESLYASGFSGHEITIISTKSPAASAVASVTVSPWKERLRPLSATGKGYISYSSIHAFKGMESPAVVVTDIDGITGATATALFYVAVTRALHRLIILVHDSARNEVINALLKMNNKG